MSTIAMTESFDAPMMDFSGEDIPMQTSSSTSWTHPEATMDDDSNFNLGDVEIEMYPYPLEYEMADDSSAEQPIEVHDVEVLDVSQAHTPALIDTVVEDVTAASPVVPEHNLTDTHDPLLLGSPPTPTIQVPLPTPQPTKTEEDHGIPGAETLGQSEWDQDHSEPPAAFPSPHPTECDQLQVPPENAEEATEPTPTWNIGTPVEQKPHLQQPTPTPVEQLQLDSSHEESAHDLLDNWGEDENAVPSDANWADPHEVSEGVFIDPPPPVILSLGDSEEEYYLFNRPTHKSPAADGRVIDDTLFLHDLPTLYYEPLAKVFQALRSDGRIAQRFDLSRGELAIDAYDLVDLVIPEVCYPLTIDDAEMLNCDQDNSYTNEVSFHDLNLLHDHADLAGPLRIRVECNHRRFIARYRELKSKLEQFNLLDEANADDPRLGDHCKQNVPPYCPPITTFTDEPAEHPGSRDDSDYLAQHEQGNENLTSEEHDQVTDEQQTDDPGSASHAVGHFGEGESSNDAEPEQAQPADDQVSTVGPLSGDECTEQPIDTVEDDREQGVATVTDPDNGYPGPAGDLDAAAIREHSDDRNTPPLGENSTEYEEVVAANQGDESDYNENDQDSGHGETVAIEGDTKDDDWATTAPDAQHLESHKDQDDADETDRCEQAARIVSTDDLTSPSTDSGTIDLTAPNADDDRITGHQGRLPSSTTASALSDPTIDTDTDSIGQRTLDEFADAQEETRDNSHPHEGVESNSATGKHWFSASFPLTLTQLPDQPNGLNPDFDQFGDEFNWDEEFGGDFDGEFDEFEDQSNVEAKPINPHEPTSGKSTKRGFDEVDSDTADEEETQGDVSPSKSLYILCVFPALNSDSLQIQSGRRCCSGNLR
jgi:hypothetical protein